MEIPERDRHFHTSDEGVREAATNFTHRLARLLAGPEQILEDVKAHPDSILLRLYAAMFWLYAQTADAQEQAGKHLTTLAGREPAMDEREAAWFDALKAWQEGRYHAALKDFENIGHRWWRDILAHKATEFLYYVLGQQYCGARFRRQTDRVAHLLEADPDFLAVRSFAHELSGDAAGAQELAEKALELAPDQVWAHHSLAHVLITKGNGGEALRQMKSYLPVWQGANRVIYCHNAWHLALVHADRLDFEGAEGVFREHVWGVMPDTPGEQVDAISLLWRLEMAGERQDDALWAEVADHTEKRVGETFMPFLDAHYAYALARAGRRDALGTLLKAVARRTEADDPEAREVWQPVGRAVVEASAAHGRGDYAAAAKHLDERMDQMPAVGGSDAQCDLFRQAYLTALRDSGRRQDAQAYWRQMTDWKDCSPLDGLFRGTLG